MATDATGTPTSLGIPKYNTSVDAPSGLGFNAAMDTIDTVITNLKKAGYEWAKGDTNTASVAINTYSNATLANLITGTATVPVGYDAQTVAVEFMSPRLVIPNGTQVRLWLFNGTSLVRWLGDVYSSGPVYLRAFHGFVTVGDALTIRADLNGVNSAATNFSGDPWAIGVNTPTTIRVVKA